MNLCMRTDYCLNDIQRVIEYANTLDVKHIWAIPPTKDYLDEDGMMNADKLLAFKATFEQEGLTVDVCTLCVDSKDIADSDAVNLKAKEMCRTIQCMGQAGIEVLFLFLEMSKPADDQECEHLWGRLIELFQNIVPRAEDSEVKIASHGHQFSSYLVQGYKDLDRIMSAVPSPYNGITFCPGCLQTFNEDIYDCIRSFGDKIFFVHIRDVIRKGIDEFDEVLLGKGEIDTPRLLRELEAIGYQGLLCPEHLPRVSYQDSDEIGSAWAYGYLTRLLSE